MSLYYIRTEDKIYELDSTSEVSITLAGKTTDFVVEDGTTVQDHYVNNNKVVSCSGKISSIKSLSNGKNLSPEEYLRGVEELKESRTPFNFVWHPLRPELTNCVFTTLTISQDSTTGFHGSSNSVGISFTIKQIRFAQQAKVSLVSSVKFADKVEAEKKGAGSGDDPKKRKTGIPAAIERAKKTQSGLIGSAL